jgi:hypothetical protein
MWMVSDLLSCELFVWLTGLHEVLQNELDLAHFCEHSHEPQDSVKKTGSYIIVCCVLLVGFQQVVLAVNFLSIVCWYEYCSCAEIYRIF